MIPRRGLLAGLGALLAAPAIIRTPGLLMPVKPVRELVLAGLDWGAEPAQLITYVQTMSRKEFNARYVAIDEFATISNEAWHSLSERERTDDTDRAQRWMNFGSSPVWTKV